VEKNRKKKERKSPPVATGHDGRPFEKERDKPLPGSKAEAPDGISGYWS